MCTAMSCSGDDSSRWRPKLACLTVNTAVEFHTNAGLNAVGEDEATLRRQREPIRKDVGMAIPLLGQHKHRIIAALFVTGLTVSCFHNVVLCGNEEVDLFRQQRALNTAQTFLDEGRREFARGTYVRSIRVLSQAIAKGADPEAFKLRGQAYDFVGHADKAVNDFNSYISARGSDPEGYILRGDAFNSDLKHDKALADFTRAIELDPSPEEAYLGRGIAYLGLEKYELAIREFRLLLQRDPHNPDALVNLGIAYMLSERPEEAKSQFEKALEFEKDPKWNFKIAEWMKRAPHRASLDGQDSDGDRNGSSDQAPTDSALGDIEEDAIRRLRHARKTSAAARPGEKALTGNWEGAFMGAKLKMEFQQSGRNINGVLRVAGRAGRDDVYHFVGTFDHGQVVASHHGGYSFRGKLTDDHRLVGVLTTAEGLKVPVDLAGTP
jgi:tetratricopeptide (TPR) repeat protein